MSQTRSCERQKRVANMSSPRLWGPRLPKMVRLDNGSAGVYRKSWVRYLKLFADED